MLMLAGAVRPVRLLPTTPPYPSRWLDARSSCNDQPSYESLHALPDKVVRARPTGVGRAISTYTIPIEGRGEWLAAARRLA